MMKRLLSITLAIIFATALMPGIAAAEGETWHCETCDADRDTPFCPVCGGQKPENANAPAAWNEDGALPVLTEMYAGIQVRMNIPDDPETRINARLGPAKTYNGAGGYKPRKQSKITAYYREANWVYADIVYQTAFERYAYLPAYSFESLEGVPEPDEVTYREGETTETTAAYWGPADTFKELEGVKVQGGTTLKCYFRENGYVYSELECSLGVIRIWLPESKVAITGEPVSYTPEKPAAPQASAGSQTEPATGGNTVDNLPAGTWSDWTFEKYPADSNTEVETRTVYRLKYEIEDWTDWIDGDPPSMDENVETRTVDTENGQVNQWRHWGYHYHYGDWSDWIYDETMMTGRASSSDIMETAEQYRYRKIQ